MVTFHEILCVSNSSVGVWESSITYGIDSVVTKNDKYFIAIVENVNSDPTEQGNQNWKEIDQTQFE